MKQTEEARFTALLADDVPELRRLLRHVLNLSDRFNVVAEAENGLQAVQLAEQHKPDLLLLDISMPVMDGIEALPKIIEASPLTQVVVLSGFDSGRMGQTALDAGAAAYLEKGIPPGTLVDRLLEIMGAGGSQEEEDVDVVSQNGTGASPPGSGGRGQSSISDVSPEEMMSLVAHEIRNPLAVIQGFGTELQNRWTTMPEEKRLDAVRRMTERSRYLNTVVNNLMFMRRLQSGQVWVDPVPLDLGELLKGVWDELRDLSRGHPVEVELEPDLPHIEADGARLRQVLTNLVVNAAKFSPAGTTISLRAFKKDGRVIVQVSDQGPGIPAGSQETIFGKFERLQEGGSGIGLGLFICRALMQSMRGNIYVGEDSPGATFCLDIPAAAST